MLIISLFSALSVISARVYDRQCACAVVMKLNMFKAEVTIAKLLTFGINIDMIMWNLDDISVIQFYYVSESIFICQYQIKF